MSKSISSQFTPSNRMELPVFLVPSVFVATWRSRGMNIICHPCCQSSSLACPNNPPMAIVKRAMCQAPYWIPAKDCFRGWPWESVLPVLPLYGDQAHADGKLRLSAQPVPRCRSSRRLHPYYLKDPTGWCGQGSQGPGQWCLMPSISGLCVDLHL